MSARHAVAMEHEGMMTSRPSAAFRTGIAIALICCAAIATPTAEANDVELSREHFKRAMKLAGEGQHAEAIREFELAFESNPKTSILYNLAHEHRMLAQQGALDEMRKSVDYYQRYLMAAPKAPDRRQVEGFITELKARIESMEADERAKALAAAAAPPPERATIPLDAVSGGAAHSVTTPDSKAKGRIPGWGWALVAVGGALVVGGGVALGFGLSAGSPPEEPLGTVTASFR